MNYVAYFKTFSDMRLNVTDKQTSSSFPDSRSVFVHTVSGGQNSVVSIHKKGELNFAFHWRYAQKLIWNSATCFFYYYLYTPKKIFT